MVSPIRQAISAAAGVSVGGRALTQIWVWDVGHGHQNDGTSRCHLCGRRRRRGSPTPWTTRALVRTERLARACGRSHHFGVW